MKILFISALLIMTACQTTSFSKDEDQLMEQCAAGIQPQSCMKLAIRYAKQREYKSAEFFAGEACEQGERYGCAMREELLTESRPVDSYRNVDRDVSFMKLMNESANRAGTINGQYVGGPRPVRTKCETSFNTFTQKLEMICE